jgi:cysteine desulfurase / selenocysteine lyase
VTDSTAVDIREARRQYPATANRVYFNTAATGLASRRLADVYRRYVDEWEAVGLDFAQGERTAAEARSGLARLIGANPADVALIPSVSSAAGLVASQFAVAGPGDNVVIGEREYSSNHFPWLQMRARGYEIRQVPFRNGGLEPEDVALFVDGRTRIVAVSGVQSATGHRSDIPAISAIARGGGAFLFVDGAQMVGAVPVADLLPHLDVLVAPDHKFLMHAGRGMGYCYLSPAIQQWLTPFNAGWRAGAKPLESFFGPDMKLSSTASRFDSSISWLAATGNVAALTAFNDYGPDAVYARNRELTSTLRAALADNGWKVVDLPEANRSTIVSVSLGAADPATVLGRLAEQGVACSARDGNLRLAVHFYNHEKDIDRLAAVLPSVL